MKDYEEHHTDTTVHFRLHMSERDLEAAEREGFEKRFKMASTFNTSNMVCFDLNGKIKKYASAEDILVDFYHKRLEYYGLRKVRAACISAYDSNTWPTNSTTSLKGCQTRPDL